MLQLHDPFVELSMTCKGELKADLYTSSSGVNATTSLPSFVVYVIYLKCCLILLKASVGAQEITKYRILHK